MITVFDVIEASTKQPDPQQPSHWKLHLDCNHKPIMSNDEIKNSLVDQRYGVEDWKTTVVCPLCVKRAPGSCKYTPIHTMIADPTPLFSRQYNQAQGKFKSALSSEEGNDKTSAAQQAVDNWFAIYQNVPEERRPAFRKSMELSKKKPELFTRLFATTDANHIAKESTDIVSWLKEEVQRLESSSN
jgi:hypothetical protein